MTTSSDPRHLKRQQLIEELFKVSFSEQEVSEEARQILEKKEIIDKTIARIAPEFPISQINRVDLAILRLAVYEMTIERKNPPKVVINEAIELAKRYGGDSSPAFVNGALAKLLN